jgi:hypothetical protein
LGHALFSRDILLGITTKPIIISGGIERMNMASVHILQYIPETKCIDMNLDNAFLIWMLKIQYHGARGVFDIYLINML